MKASSDEAKEHAGKLSEEIAELKATREEYQRGVEVCSLQLLPCPPVHSEYGTCSKKQKRIEMNSTRNARKD